MKYIPYFPATGPFFAQAGSLIRRPFQPSNSLHPGRFSHTAQEEAQHGDRRPNLAYCLFLYGPHTKNGFTPLVLG